MLYEYNPHHHVKVWLTNNPDVFMNFENQTRLIEMREQNPQDLIHLIYDSSLLNKQAHNELVQFCEENRLTPVDANQFGPQLESDDERTLYSFYQDEITHLKEGGNLGVASDILRWLPPSYRLGSYTDLDVPLATQKLPTTISVDAPLILNIGSLKLWGTQEMVLVLNEYIAVVDETKAKKQIQQIHKGLIDKLRLYSSNYIEQTENKLSQGSFLNRILMGYMKNRAESLYIQKSTELRPSDLVHTSRRLRAYVNEVMTDREKYLDFKRSSVTETNAELIQRLRKEIAYQQGFSKWLFFRKDYYENRAVLTKDDDQFISYLMRKERSLYLKSIVICTTGPIEVGNSLYNSYVMSSTEVNKTVQPMTLSHYALDNAFLSNNVIPLHESPWSMLKFLGADVGELNDSSWLEEGVSLQKIREQQLLARQKQLKQELPSLLLKIEKEMRMHLEELENASKSWFGFLGRSKRTEKIDALHSILCCFNKTNRLFDVAQLQRSLKLIDSKRVFSGWFSRKSSRLTQEITQLCHEAIVLRLVQEKQISLVNESPKNSSDLSCITRKYSLLTANQKSDSSNLITSLKEQTTSELRLSLP